MLNKLLTPWKNKSVAYVISGIVAVCFFGYVVLESNTGWIDYGSMFAGVLIAFLFAVMGVCVNNGNKAGILGALTMIMGYFSVDMCYNGLWYVTLDYESISWTIANITFAIAAVAFAVATLTFLFGKFVGYKKETMIKVGLSCFWITFLLMIVTDIAVLTAGDFEGSVYYFIWCLSTTFVPLACIANAGLSETVNK